MAKNKLPHYSLSIIIPMINEINSLKKTIEIIDKIKCKKEYNIIISKKLTSKNTLLELNKLKKKYSNLFVYIQKKKFVGGAVAKGIEKSKYTYIAIMAADMETNPCDLKKMVQISKHNLNKIITGDRWLNKNSFKKYSFIKLILNFLAQKIISQFYKVNIKDFTFAYRIYPKKALSKIVIDELRHGFALELILKPIKLGYKVINFPTKWRARTEGNPTSSLLTYYSFLKVLIKNLI
jgi:glycosyltransferase involved in cell wall biosynthesis